MTTQHTPEPWAIQSHGLPEGLHGIIAPHHTKWFVAEDCKKADAIRIVACVNACAGIPTEVLAPLGLSEPPYKTIAENERRWKVEAQQQRDELKEQSSRLAAEAVRQAQQNADLCVKNAELLAAAEIFRDSVLHQRHSMAENGMTNDQVNDVLGLFDDTLGEAIAKAGGKK